MPQLVTGHFLSAQVLSPSIQFSIFCLMAVQNIREFPESKYRFLEIHILYSYIFSKTSAACQGCQIFAFIIIIPLQYGSAPSWHKSCPRFPESGFCPVVRFFKKCIFGIYMLWGVSRCKNFLRQNLSGNRFCSKRMVFQHFSQFIILVYPKQSETKILVSLTFPGCRNPDFLSKFSQKNWIYFLSIICFFFEFLWISIACSGLFHGKTKKKFK